MGNAHLAKWLSSEPVDELASDRAHDEDDGEENSRLHLPQLSSDDPDREDEPQDGGGCWYDES